MVYRELGQFTLNAMKDQWTVHHEYSKYAGNNRDVCLIYIEDDLSSKLTSIPIILENLNIDEYHGAACWTAGWGTKRSAMSSILVSL